jgi:GTPase SAR1 family protein
MCKIFVVSGLAGSGKTMLTAHLKENAVDRGKRVYLVNLDPAVESVPYVVNLDIRDTVNYRRIMQDRKIGPNGAIILALNMFVTKIHQLDGLLRTKVATHDYIVVDTPGQIEMFTWSAAGDILVKTLASIAASTESTELSFLYLIDNAKRKNNAAFAASNLLYACSIRHNIQFPLKLVYTKCDLHDGRWEVDEKEDSSDTYSELFHRDVFETFAPLFAKFEQHYVDANPASTNGLLE